MKTNCFEFSIVRMKQSAMPNSEWDNEQFALLRGEVKGETLTLDHS